MRWPRVKEHPIRAIIDLVVDRPWATLALILLLTSLFIFQLPRLSFRTSIYDLIIEDLPEAQRYRLFLERFGSDEILQLVVRADDVFDRATWAKIEQLSAAAQQLPGVRRILSLAEIKKQIDQDASWDMQRFAAVIEPARLFDGHLISADHSTTAITMILQADADKRKVVDSVEELIATAGTDLSLYQMGIPVVSQAMAQYTRQDILRLTPIALAVIALVLYLLFRHWCFILLPLCCVGFSVIWTFGLMAWLHIPVSMLTVILPIFIIAVGTAYCLHLCAAYLEVASEIQSPRAAARQTTRNQILPVVLAVVTTILGIGSLLANRIPSIQEFALFACFGLVSLLLMLVVAMPAALALLPVSALKASPPPFLNRWLEKWLKTLVVLNTRHQKKIWMATALLILFLIAGVLQMRVETNPVAFFKKHTPVSHNFTDIYQRLAGSFPVNVTMRGPMDDFFEKPSSIHHLAKFQRYLEGIAGIDKTVSLADYVMLVNYASNQYDPAFYRLPEDKFELRMSINNFRIMLGDDMLQRFLSADYREASILLLTHLASSRQFLQTREQILGHAQRHFPEDIEWAMTGLGSVIADSSHLLTVGQLKSLSISLLLVFSAMFLLFLSSKVGIVAIVPNLFPILVNFGLMGWLGIPLSVATSLIASVVIGLAVDDTIHYLVRYNTEFKKDLDKDRAMHDTLKEVGRPIFFTSLTIGLGFAVLAFSNFQPTAVFGGMMVLTMLAALVGDLILLPSLMLHVELVTAWDLLRMIPTVSGIPPGFAHELNQPLNAIKVGCEFLKLMGKSAKEIPVNKLAAVTGEISAQVDRAAEMVRRFSAISSKSTIEKEQLDLNFPIQGTLEILENQLRLDNVALKLDLAENLPLVRINYNQMVQVVFNLIQNGWEAIARKRLQDGDNGAHFIRIQSAADTDNVRVIVQDSGTGIADEMQERIFEPFFTTKPSGKGKGLGLSISRQIMRDCGGKIAIDTTVGQGTTIVLSFPAAQG